MKPSKTLFYRAGGILASMALAAGLYAGLSAERVTPRGGALEKITIAGPLHIASTNILVAQSKGLFRKYGLEVTLQNQSLGKFAVAAIVEGKADLAVTTEVPFVLAILRGNKLSLLATLYTAGAYDVIVARQDRGVAAPDDLAGKKIGTPFGSSAHFFLDSFLTLLRVPAAGIEFIDLQSSDIVDALTSGRVDAVSTFPPYTLRLRALLAGRGIEFSDPAFSPISFNLVGTMDLVRKRPATIRKLLRALLDAAEFTRAHPREAHDIAADYLNLDRAEAAVVWDMGKFNISLSQSLLTMLEQEAAWAIQRKLTTATTAPRFLDYIDADDLAAVMPTAVTLIR